MIHLVYEVGVSSGAAKHWLKLTVWDNETGKIYYVKLLAELYNSEINFAGGRFRKYVKHVITYPVSVLLTNVYMDHPKNIRPLDCILGWIGENIDGEWNMVIVPDEPVLSGSSMINVTFYFEDVSDAVYTKLRLS